MKFILFVEGHTEHKAISAFLKKWLDPQAQLTTPVGIQPVRFEGWANLVKDSPTKAKLYLPQKNIIAVIALIDLYGSTFYPENKNTASERYGWAKKDLEKKVGHKRFYQYFAVHEVEAWLLSDPSIFPRAIQPSIKKITSTPETINDTLPPAKLLERIYRKETNRGYKKLVHGRDLFSKLDPNVAYEK